MYLKSIVLSGGPCAGKTITQKALYDHFTARGFDVHLIREVASMIVRSGIHFKKMPESSIPELQRNILMIQRDLEKRFDALSELSDKPVLLISDRGGIDALSYVSDSFQKQLLREEKLSLVGLRDDRYDGVFHMVTSADGAPDGFKKATHAFRNESVEEAIHIDRCQLNLWLGHPHLRIFDNHCSFEEKVKKVIEAAEHLLGIPEPVEYERKFLIRNILPEQLPVPYCTVDIEQHYLTCSEGKPFRIRKRGQDGTWMYYITQKEDISEGKRMETEHRISEAEYERLCSDKGTQHQGYVKKTRTCFVYGSLCYELDLFSCPETGFTLVECETDDDNTPVPFPPFLQLIREVTGEKEFSNFYIASRTPIS